MPQTVTQTSGVNQVVFLTVNHRGPLPLRELHSTDETTVWRDPGGSWACLLPVYMWIHLARGCDTNKWQLCKADSFSYGVSPQTPPLEGTSLHRRNNIVERPWGILSLLLPVIFVKQVIFLTVNHRGPLPLRELHSTGETRVWRDPGGSWACLRPVYGY